MYTRVILLENYNNTVRREMDAGRHDAAQSRLAVFKNSRRRAYIVRACVRACARARVCVRPLKLLLYVYTRAAARRCVGNNSGVVSLDTFMCTNFVHYVYPSAIVHTQERPF